MDYRFFAPNDWSEGVSRFHQDERGRQAEVVLTGDCPRCAHPMDVVVPLRSAVAVVADPASAKMLRKRRGRKPFVDGDDTFQLTASCNCHMTHAGRPDDVAVGCGAFGNLAVAAGA